MPVKRGFAPVAFEAGAEATLGVFILSDGEAVITEPRGQSAKSLFKWPCISEYIYTGSSSGKSVFLPIAAKFLARL